LQVGAADQVAMASFGFATASRIALASDGLQKQDELQWQMVDLQAQYFWQTQMGICKRKLGCTCKEVVATATDFAQTI